MNHSYINLYMKKYNFYSIACLALCIAVQPLFAQSEWQNKVQPELLDQIAAHTKAECIIILDDQADLSGAQYQHTKLKKGQFVYETLTAHAEKTQGEVRALLSARDKDFTSFWIVNMVVTVANSSLLAELAALKSVKRIETNPTLKRDAAPQEAESTLITEERNTSISWGLDKIKAPQVWAMGITGAGVTVGGQDTGYEWEHRAIKSKYRGWNGTIANHNYNWHDAISADINGGVNTCGLNLMSPCDDNRHGTHTMGTMVGSPSSDSVIGVAPGAKWIGCRNMESGDGTPSTYIDCFQWFLAPTNLANQAADPSMAPHVINNSWGCPTSEGCNIGNFGVMESAVNALRTAGVVVVVSAGNSGSACSTVNSPAAIFASSYSVGATNSSDGIAGFSSRGPVTVNGSGTLRKPNIAAPGVGILSCVGSANNQAGFGYDVFQGTSMAGPHVAGLVALMIQARPALAGQVSMIEQIIDASAVKLYPAGTFCGADNATSSPNNVFGAGRIDALAAVQMAQVMILPVDLVDFKVQKQVNTTLLTWETASETNCDRYEIERSPNLTDWYSIGTISCAGAANKYQYRDAAPLRGVNYYRLRQIDANGEAHQSPLRSVTFVATNVSLVLQPNPNLRNVGFEVVGLSNNESQVRIEIHGIDGRLVGQYQTSARGELILPDLARGIYVAALLGEAGEILTVQRFLW
jgi:serine protease AprX